jgi:hypothetical protein
MPRIIEHGCAHTGRDGIARRDQAAMGPADEHGIGMPRVEGGHRIRDDDRWTHDDGS